MPSHSSKQTVRITRAAARRERLCHIRNAPTIDDFRTFLRYAEPRAIKIYAGTCGRGSEPNLEAERDDGSRVAYDGRMRKDGTFRRRTDLDRYNPNNLIFVGYVDEKVSTAT